MGEEKHKSHTPPIEMLGVSIRRGLQGLKWALIPWFLFTLLCITWVLGGGQPTGDVQSSAFNLVPLSLVRTWLAVIVVVIIVIAGLLAYLKARWIVPHWYRAISVILSATAMAMLLGLTDILTSDILKYKYGLAFSYTIRPANTLYASAFLGVILGIAVLAVVVLALGAARVPRRRTDKKATQPAP